MKKKLILSLSIALVLATCFGVLGTSALFAGTSLLYNYPITFYTDSFGRNNSNHDGTTISVKQGTSTTPGMIKSVWSGYGSQTDKIFNLETGALTKTMYSGGVQQSTVTIKAPSLGGNKTDYLALLRELKTDVEYVELGRGADLSTDKTQLRSTNRYLSNVLYQLDKPVADSLTFWSMDQNTTNYVDLVNNLRPGMAFNLKMKYKATVERDMLVDLFVNGQYVTGTRYTVPAGEDAFKGGFTIPSTVKPSDTCKFYFKLIPKGGTWQQKTTESSVDVKIKPAYSIDDFYAFKDYSSSGVLYGVGFYIPKDMDIRIDVIDPATGKWIWGKQSTYKYSSTSGGNGSFYETVNIPGLQLDKQYRMYVKLLPVGGAWNTYVVEKFTDFIYQ